MCFGNKFKDKAVTEVYLLYHYKST